MCLELPFSKKVDIPALAQVTELGENKVILREKAKDIGEHKNED